MERCVAHCSVILTRDARLQIVLIDFGASREYRREFVDDYIHVIHGAAVNDRAQVLDYSTRLGFLTGYESKVSDVIRGAAVNDRAQVLDYSTRLGFLTGYESKVSDATTLLCLS